MNKAHMIKRRATVVKNKNFVLQLQQEFSEKKEIEKVV